MFAALSPLKKQALNSRFPFPSTLDCSKENPVEVCSEIVEGRDGFGCSQAWPHAVIPKRDFGDISWIPFCLFHGAAALAECTVLVFWWCEDFWKEGKWPLGFLDNLDLSFERRQENKCVFFSFHS